MTTTTPEAEILGKIYTETKGVAACQLKYVRLEAVNKLSSLFTFFILIIVGVNLTMCLLIFLTFQLAFLLATLWGRLSLAILAIFGVYLMLGSLLYINRKNWILQPITRMFLRTFNLHTEAMSSNPAEEVNHQKELAQKALYQQRKNFRTTLNNAIAETHRPTMTEALVLLAKHGTSIYNGIKMGFNFIKKRRGS